MRYLSTRSKAKVSFAQAICRGLAPDGGLYVPEGLPNLRPLRWPKGLSFLEIAEKILPAWTDNFDKPTTQEICQAAFSFPTPLKFVNERLAFLELFHGPTAAFKDIGARFLSESLFRLEKKKFKKERRILLVATSGDTGSAVASAFFRKPGIDVVILYPKGGVSKRQELQLTTWGSDRKTGANVQALCVRGTFDDCQRLVKEAFTHSSLPKTRFLSANSINLGRLLPQTFYYAWSSLSYYHEKKVAPGYIVPTGNLGNALAALWAKQMGFPIREVVFATNANRSILEFWISGEWVPRSTIPTLANAMDVGHPSNMERLLSLYPDRETLRREVSVASISDAEICQAILFAYQQWGYFICPHTATAVATWAKVLSSQDWILVSTAHPAKFETIVEPLLQAQVPVPAAFASLLLRKEEKMEMDPKFENLERILKSILAANVSPK